MDAADLVAAYPPPAPPIFASSRPPWRRWGYRSGAAAWRALAEATGDRSIRSAPVISRSAWEELTRDHEVTRRLKRRQLLGLGSRKLQIAEAGECRASLLHWLGHWGWLEAGKESDPTARIFPAVLFPFQASLLLWLEDLLARETDSMALVCKGREVGATSLVCLLCAHRLLFEPSFAASLLALRMDDVDGGGRTDTLMQRVRLSVERCPPWMAPPGSRRRTGFGRELVSQIGALWETELGSTVTGHPTAGEMGRGGRRRLTLLDEHARMHPTTQEALIQAASTAARLLLLVSSPANTPSTPFERKSRELPTSQVVELGWQVDPRRDRAWWDGQLVEHGGLLTRPRREVEHNLQHGAAPESAVFAADLPAIDPEDAPLAIIRDWWGGMDIGTGEAWTTLILLGMSPTGHRPWAYAGRSIQLGTLYLTVCRGWYRTRSTVIARDILEEWGGYEGALDIAIDPSAAAPDQHQESWLGTLQREGLPVRPASTLVDREAGRQELIAHVDDLIGAGLLVGVGEAGHEMRRRMASWEMSGGKPAKGEASHYGEALLYAVDRILRSAPLLGRGGETHAREALRLRRGY